MKYIKLNFLLILALLTIGFCIPTNSKTLSINTAKFTSPVYFKAHKNSQSGRKTKDGRFRRKKGFMWGLFKGRSACDCPKH